MHDRVPKIVGLSLLLAAVASERLDACLCTPGSIENEFASAAAVFSGTVEDIAPYEGGDCPQEHRVDFLVKLKVSRVWKGSNEPSIVLHVGRPIGDCDGFTFEVGRAYLVYAYTYSVSRPERFRRFEHRLGVGTCSRTTELSRAEEDIRTLDAR